MQNPHTKKYKDLSAENKTKGIYILIPTTHCIATLAGNVTLGCNRECDSSVTAE